MRKTVKNIIWVGDSLKRLQQFPAEVKDSVGYALHKVQIGKIPRNSKQLKRLKPTVMEIVADHDTDTYRYLPILTDTYRYLSSSIYC